MVQNSTVTLIFCGPDSELVRELRISHPNASIVVVSRLPEVMDWLDAIEAGADDYCAPPFEPVQIRWILNANLRASRLAA
jgi:DNA-binding response OmpR family regulator